MTVDKVIFGRNLTALKEKSGKTWGEIAEDLGYKNERAVLKFAQGRWEPRLKTVRMFATYFGVSPWQKMLEDGHAAASE